MSGRPDYADAFEVEVVEGDDRTAEQWARCALEQAPSPLRWTVLLAHRHLLRFRLAPPGSSGHILGWTIVASRPDVIHLEASGPLMRGVVVGRRSGPGQVVLSSFVFFSRSPARLVWTVATPVHRAAARHLLARAATAARG